MKLIGRTFLLLLFTMADISFAQTKKMNDAFKMYICPRVLGQNCSINVVFTNNGIETEVTSVKFKKFIMYDPGGYRSDQQCLAFKLPRSSMDARIAVRPHNQCKNSTIKLLFLDKGSFLGDFEIYYGNGEFKEQLRYVTEKTLNPKNSSWVFNSNVHNLGIITSLGDIKL